MPEPERSVEIYTRRPDGSIQPTPNDPQGRLATHNPGIRTTPWHEQLQAQTNGEMVIMPTWGISQIRDITTTENGATAQEQDGLIHLDTAAQANSKAQLQTRQRGTYKPRMTAVVSALWQLSTDTFQTGQKFETGAVDERNGFGFGHDDAGPYIFRKKAQSLVDQVHQANWNLDTLDGTGPNDNNPSGLTYDPTNATIGEVVWHWYGRGTVVYYLQVKDDTLQRGDEMVFVPVHRLVTDGNVLVEDPNLPIRTTLENGAATTAINAKIGGRSYARQGGDIRLSRRPVPAKVTGLTISEETYTPIAAVRVKDTFRGRPNSIPVFFNSATIAATQFTEFKAGYLDTVTATPSSGWNPPEGWSASETAIEAVAQNASRELTTNQDGPAVPLNTFHPGGAPQSRIALQRQQRLPLHRGDTVVLYAKKRAGGSNTNVDVAITVDEEW